MRPKWVFTSGETEVRGMWVFFPCETPDARKVGVTPGETVVARKMGVPGRDELLCVLLDYYCIESAYVLTRRRHSPRV